MDSLEYNTVAGHPDFPVTHDNNLMSDMTLQGFGRGRRSMTSACDSVLVPAGPHGSEGSYQKTCALLHATWISQGCLLKLYDEGSNIFVLAVME